MSSQLSLFTPKESPQRSIYDLVSAAKAVVTNILDNDWGVVLPVSLGKDSSCVLSLVLSTAAKLKSTNPIYVVHADTGIENPEISMYAMNEMASVNEFSSRYSLNVKTEVTNPSASNNWTCRILGGKELPTFVNSSQRRCSINYKQHPIAKKLRELKKQLRNNGRKYVTIMGTRFSESTSRSHRMTERNESTSIRYDEKLDEYRLSLICEWSSDDVWEYLALAQAGEFNTYSNFKETFRIYADSAGTSCAVVADDILGKQSTSACGARHGCWACNAVGRDASLESMLATDPRYRYMDGLQKLRQFLLDTQYDLSRRNWVGRTLTDEGYLKIIPDGYSPAMLRELLGYVLTLDAIEQDRASKSGIAPRFKILSEEKLIAVDATWSLYGLSQRPFEAISLWNKVYHEGVRFLVPTIPPAPQCDIPDAKYIDVSDTWDEIRREPFSGIRSAIMEALEEKDCIGTKVLESTKKGPLTIMSVETDCEFSVHPEGALNALDYELETMMEMHGNESYAGSSAYLYYLQLGVISIAKNQLRVQDHILRRTRLKERLGVSGDAEALSRFGFTTVGSASESSLSETPFDLR